MKLIREHINEKFEEESDPIQDLGIGSINRFKDFLTLFGQADERKYVYSIHVRRDFIDFWFNAPKMRNITSTEKNQRFNYITNIIEELGFENLLIKPKFFYSNDQGVTPFLIRFQLASAAKNKLKVHQYRRKDYTEDPVFYPYTREREETDTEYERKVQIHSGGYINEKFIEEGDPIHDMGISLKQYIQGQYKKLFGTGGNVWDLYDTLFKPIYGEKYRGLSVYLVRIPIHTIVKILKNISFQSAFEKTCKEEYYTKGLDMSEINIIRQITADFLNKNFYIDIDPKFKRHTTRKRKINEEFIEYSDPIKDIGIGVEQQVKNFMKSINQEYNLDSALVECARFGKLEFVKYLLNAGADVHAYNDYALSYAAFNGHTKVVKVLLNAGANVRARNNLALYWANTNGHDDIVKIIINHIAKQIKINEKFSKESDPIRDMGIGYETYVKHKLGLSYDKQLPDIFTGKKYLYKDQYYSGEEIKYWTCDNSEDYSFYGFETVNGILHIIAAWSEYEYKDAVYYILFPVDQFFEDIKESLNEKFKEQSDPIHDLEIGLYRDFDTVEEMIDYIYKNLSSILDVEEIPRDILNQHGYYIKPVYYEKIKDYIRKYFTIKGIKIEDELSPIDQWMWDLQYWLRKLIY